MHGRQRQCSCAELGERLCASKTDASLQVLSLMRNDGLDLSKSRQITHVFLGQDQSLKTAATVLAARKFKVIEQAGGRLVVEVYSAVSDQWVRDTISTMCKLASDTGTQYDGWDIDVAGEVPVKR